MMYILIGIVFVLAFLAMVDLVTGFIAFVACGFLLGVGFIIKGLSLIL